MTFSCPACKGKSPRIDRVFANYGMGDPRNGPEEREFICAVCDGKGNATDEDSLRVQIGRAHKIERISRGETLYECAQRYGWSSVEVCAMEMGKRGAKVPPTEAMDGGTKE